MITLKSTSILRIFFALAVVMIVTGAAFPMTYTVTNTNDSDSGSLRWAIESANDNPGLDLIAFNIPGPGPHTIQPLTALPLIIDPVTIDGYTQPGTAQATYASPATLLVELDGSNVWDTGLNVWLAGNSTIRGLVINRFGDVAIHVHEGGGNVIEGNYIGTDVSGTVDLGNYDHGIRIWDSPDNRIGGTSPAARNIISGNDHMGIQLLLPFCTGNRVQGNYIGTDATGTAALGNGDHGILMSEEVSDTIIGPGNVISNSGGAAIEIGGEGTTTNHQIVGNLIGTNASATGVLGNTFGIRLLDCSGNIVEDNIVANSQIVGITVAGYPGVSPSSNNTVTGNTVKFSEGFGIQIESSDNNIIYNNNFIDNGLSIGYQVVDHLGTGNVFHLDKPIGGNYWSEWTGPDADGDGFVDEPYIIWTPEGPYGEYGNQDNLPWASEDSWSNGCLIKQLIVQVDVLDLPKGTENSLMAKLENAARKLYDQNIGAAINSLNAFINEVEAQRGKKIPDADALITAAQEMIAALEEL
jgi:parallel beta-helix repeat protein